MLIGHVLTLLKRRIIQAEFILKKLEIEFESIFRFNLLDAVIDDNYSVWIYKRISHELSSAVNTLYCIDVEFFLFLQCS